MEEILTIGVLTTITLVFLYLEFFKFRYDFCGISAVRLGAKDIALFLFVVFATVYISFFTLGLIKKYFVNISEYPFLHVLISQIFYIFGMLLFVRLTSSKVEFSESYVSKFKAILWGAYYTLSIAAMFLLALAWKYLITYISGAEPEQQETVGIIGSASGVVNISLAVFSVVFLAPITEEMFFRGLLYRIFKAYINPVIAAILTAILFSMSHANLLASLPLFVFSIVFCLAYERSGSIVTPIILHSTFNALNLLLVISK